MSVFESLLKDESPEGKREPDLKKLERGVIAALPTVYDPKMPLNIGELGLIYELDVDDANGPEQIQMTLTAPGCPAAQTFPATTENAVKSAPGVEAAHVELVWDPPWSRDMMTEAARLDMGMF